MAILIDEKIPVIVQGFTFQLHKFLRLTAKNGVKAGGSSSFALSAGCHQR